MSETQQHLQSEYCTVAPMAEVLIDRYIQIRSLTAVRHIRQTGKSIALTEPTGFHGWRQ